MYIIQQADGNNFELLTSFLLLKKDSLSLFPFFAANCTLFLFVYPSKVLPHWCYEAEFNLVN